MGVGLGRKEERGCMSLSPYPVTDTSLGMWPMFPTNPHLASLPYSDSFLIAIAAALLVRVT